ncbi:hypothetical protein GE061_004898 [Apolygus lucorum]|uniref:HMG box domain-containing protein n=1 Tax=Apolygus lucorum TaxID=248454 RepID=A0A8S9WYN3_APOLU|nr:hypothetical protein GE061_004898 [Apolygus lucorum]
MNPRRPHGAYTLFVKEQWRNRDLNVPFVEYSKEIANRWNNMDEGEKSTWHVRAAREKKKVQGRSAPLAKRLAQPIKRPRTAYIFFSMDRRQMVMREHPNSSFAETTRILGRMWAKLTTQEKGKYTKRAEADKRRYEREIKKIPIRRPHGAYTLFVREQWKNRNLDVSFTSYSKEVANRWSNMNEREKTIWHERAEREKSRIVLESPRSAPIPKRKKQSTKRPRTAFIFFCMDKRQMVLRENPNSSFAETARILGNMWTQLTSSEKETYTKRAEADKKRYEREIKNNTKQASTTKRGRPVGYRNNRNEESTSRSNESSSIWSDVCEGRLLPITLF